MDSGSDDTIFDTEVADAVGIPWATGASYPVAGFSGGTIDVRFTEASYEIGGHRFSVGIGVAPMPSMFKAVLGQTGFFNRAIVMLDQSNNRIEIKF